MEWQFPMFSDVILHSKWIGLLDKLNKKSKINKIEYENVNCYLKIWLTNYSENFDLATRNYTWI